MKFVPEVSYCYLEEVSMVLYGWNSAKERYPCVRHLLTLSGGQETFFA